MRKRELITEISQRTGLGRRLVTQILDQLIDTIRESVMQKRTVYLRQFGSFHAQYVAQRVGRVIQAKKSVTLPAHYKPAFKPARIFAQAVREKHTVYN